MFRSSLVLIWIELDLEQELHKIVESRTNFLESYAGILDSGARISIAAGNLVAAGLVTAH
jgi:hypothetical protein